MSNPKMCRAYEVPPYIDAVYATMKRNDEP